ncbi:MAG: chaperone NapD [Acidobacteria bacterium]|nr:chaperone NapD [Acidobacteriota bacterium]
MNVSSIVVRVAPSGVAGCVQRLAAMPGVEVQFTDTDAGRIVLTQESETTDEQEAGLRRIQALPGLLSAELVCHYFGDLEEDAEGT